MSKIRPRKAELRASIQFRSFVGKNNPDISYLLVKGRVRKTQFYNVFTAVELKGACLDILSMEDTPENRKQGSNDLAKKVWEEQ